MITTTRSRRTAALAAGLLGAVLALSGCGGGGSTPQESAGAPTAGYPVTVATEFGDVTLTAKPERIVVVNSSLDVDILAALGEPAAATGGSLDAQAAAELAPWLDDSSSGEYVAGLVDDTFTPAREAMAAQEPDLIIFFGAGSPLDQAEYDQLIEVAPVYAYTGVPPWRDEVATIGKLVGKPEQAAQLVADMEAAYTAARDRLPGLQGRTFFHGVAGPNGIYAVPSVVQFFAEFGMEPADLQPVASERPLTLAQENLDQMTADVVFLAGEAPARAALEADPRFAELPSVQGGTMVFLEPLIDKVTIPSQIGPAAVPWLLDRLVPALETASLNTGA